MASKDQTNPASRLHSILLALKAHALDGVAARDVIARALDVNRHDNVQLVRRLVMVDALFEETIRLIYGIEGIDHDEYVSHFPKVRAGLIAPSLDADASKLVAFRGAWDPVVLEAVKFCGMRIGESFREQLISDQDLAELDLQARELFEFTLASDLESEIKRVSLDLIELLRSSIAEYRITGAKGLEEAMERAIGKLHRYAVKKEKKPGVNRDQLIKLFDLMIKFDTVIAKSAAYAPVLAEYLPKLLGA